MASFEDRIDARRKTFKKGVDADDARRRREDENVQLRKAKRDEQLSKKRFMREDAENSENEPVNANLSLDPGMAAAAAKLKDPATDPQTRVAVVTEIRKQLSRATKPPIQEAINAGICALAVKYLGSDDAKLQFEASWVLTNIASGESHQTQAVVDAGGVPAFLEILRTSTSVETKEQVVWAMANIAGDSAKLRNFCLQAGTMDAFLNCLVQCEDRTEMLKHATWGISNLCRGKPRTPIEYVSKAMPYLVRLLSCNEPEVLTDALWALSYIADGDEAQINLLLESGVVGTVVQALGCGNDEYGTPAIRVVGNIATGSHQQTQVLLSCGVLGQLPPFLHAKKSNLVKEACWLLSNVTAGTPDQIQAVIDAGLLSKILDLCLGGSSHLIRKEAFWTVANLAVGGRPDQIHAAVGLGLIKALVEGLAFQGDAQLICAIIDGLSGVLKVGAETDINGENRYFALMEEIEGSQKLEALQEDQNEEVYQRAVALLQHYCEVENEDDAYESEVPAQTEFNFA